jgi:tetratricopeptide (TPR) repeat protein
MTRLSNYATDLEQIDRDIAMLEGTALVPPVSGEKAAKYVYRLYHRATLIGDLNQLRHVLAAIDQTLYHLGPAEDVCLLKANVHFSLHQLREARHDLGMARLLPQRIQARVLLADIDYEEGRYEDAQRAYEHLVAESKTWDNLARLAHFHAKMGDFEYADQLYADAQEEITAKEMRAFSWVELQRGLLDLMHGRFDETQAHYERADRAYSGYWLVREHLADLFTAEEKFETAAGLYEAILAQVPRPELRDKLGKVLCSLGRFEEAERCFERALAAYLDSANRGEVHYYHHLAEFFVEVRKDGQSATKWARMDLELRSNYATEAALAWAEYCCGEFAQASKRISRALSSGIVDPNLLAKAAEIYKAAGRERDGHELEHRAASINPLYMRVHWRH